MRCHEVDDQVLGSDMDSWFFDGEALFLVTLEGLTRLMVRRPQRSCPDQLEVKRGLLQAQRP